MRLPSTPAGVRPILWTSLAAISLLLGQRLAGTGQSGVGSSGPATTFSLAPSYAAGTKPISVAVADVNRDSKLDLVVANSGSNNVSILLGNGDGSFQTPVNYSAGTGPSSVAIGDFNGDAKVDLVVANASSNNVSVLIGNGDGTFQAAVSYAAGSKPSSVAVGDLNNDNKLDLAVANQSGNNVSVLFGNGDGTFGTAANYAVGTGPTSIALEYFSADNVLDMAVANGGSNNVSVLVGNGNGTFGTAVNYAAGAGSNPLSVVVGDFNADGKADLAVATNSQIWINVLTGNGDGSFRSAVSSHEAGTFPTGLAVGDFNKDGKPDLVISNNGSNTMTTLLGSGNAAFHGYENYDGGADMIAIAVGDFNGDGNLDAVAVNELSNSVSVFVGRADGTFVAPFSYGIGGTPQSVAPGDFGNNGIVDLVASNGSSGPICTPGCVSVLTGLGNGTFSTNAANYTAGAGPRQVGVADFNGDGLPDVLAVNSGSNSVSVLLGKSAGTFGAAASYSAGTSPVAVATGDFNRDGKPDLAVANAGTPGVNSNVSVLLGNGDGSFQSPVNYGVGITPTSVAVGDFNGDGKLDLVVGNAGSAGANSTVSVLLGSGDGTFQASMSYSAGVDPTSLAVWDLNGDGKLDLAVANGTTGGASGTVSVLLGNGDGTFKPAVSYGVGVNPLSLAEGDLNGDGKPDLMVANQGYVGAGSGLSLLFGNGDGTFQTAVNYYAGSKPDSVTVVDLNGDGAPDVAMTSSNAGVTVLLNNGGTNLATIASPNPSNAGQTVTFTTTGSASLGVVTATPTGMITYLDNSVTLGSVPLSGGVATFSTASLSAGTHSITAVYSGDSNFNPHTSAVYIQTVQGSAVSLSPSSLTWPGQSVGSTSSGQTVTLTNTGNAALTITSVAVSGDFAQINACGSSVAAGATCTFTMTFTPTTTGTRNGAVTISDNAPGSPQTISLSGTGTAPGVVLVPSSLAFGNQLVGARSAAQIVTLNNTGSATLNISAAATGPDYSQTNTCGSSVSAGGTCTFSVTFAPTTIGVLNESLTITDDAGGSPQTVSLTGTGTAPTVNVVPSTLTFAGQQVGTSSGVQSLTLSNTGAAALAITSIAASGDFSQTNTCGSTLAAGASCTISVTFTPSATGTRTGAITISDNANGSPQTVSLTGTGTAPAASLSPTSLSFGTQYVGTPSAAQAVILTNTGTTALTISGVSIGPDYAQTNNCGSLVAAGASCTFNITFVPSAIGPLNESLLITDNAPDSPQSVALSGTGVAPAAPAVSLSSSSLIFGAQTVGTTSGSQPVTLTNSGNAALSIASILPRGDFALATTASSCPYSGGTVNPGASCTIDVTFTPTIVGAEAGTVTIKDNAADSPQSVALTGTGLSASPNAVPQMNQPVVPGSAVPGGSGFTLTVNGAGFVPGSTIDWNGTSLATSFVSNRQLTASVPASDVSAAATTSISVVNGTPGGGTSNVIFFPVTNPTPSVSLGRLDAATGNGPVWLGTADFNRDGKADLAVANSVDNSVSILLGNGDGTFIAEPAVNAGSGPVAAASGDVNRDGIADLAVVNGVDNTVSILLGVGDGTFTSGPPVSPGSGPAAAALGDLNGDGKVDLVVADATDNTLAVLLGNGDGTFGGPSTFAVGTNPQAVVIADFNRDGVLDLAAANNADGTLSILMGNGDGTFALQSVTAAGQGPVSLAAGDLNGDGIVDLAAADNDVNTVTILVGNGDGSFAAGTAVASGNSPAAVALGDLNGDGIPDLAVANAIESTISVMLGNGDGTFQSEIAFTTGTGPASATIADFNNDGRMDVASADQGSGSVSILLQSAAVTLSVTSLSFGDQAVGSSSSAQTATLTNTGSATLNISGVTIGKDYTQTNTCGNAVAAGANCTFTVTFTPSSSGVLNESITITDNADGSPQTVSLTGTGTAPAVTLSPSNLTFSSQQVSTSSSPQAVTLTNSGSAVLTITSVVASGDFSQTNTCASTVNAGATCTFSVTFTPTATGTRTGAVTVADNAADGPETISLTGTGVAPAVSLSPSSLSFGNQAVGSSSSGQTVTLTNTGSAALSISGVTTGSDYAQTDTCGNSVAAGATCTFTVTFSPTSSGALNESLSITDNAAGSPQIVPLTGTGTAPAATLSPTSLTFASQQVGSSSSPQTITLTDSGTATLTISGIVASGDFSQTNTCGSSVNAGANCTISVTFTPTASGTRTGVITVTDNAGGSPQIVSLSGTGTAPAVTLSPTSLTFAGQQVGTSSTPQTVTLTNSGSATLKISSLAFTGTNKGDFSQTTTCPTSLAAGESCTFNITFKPTASGTRTAAFSITDNAAGSPQTVSLSGTGTAPSVSLSPVTLTFAVQLVKTTSTAKTVTLTNTGTATLTITSITLTGTNAADFAQSNTCGSSVAAGGNCTISVTFTPSASGTRTGTLNVNDNASGSPQKVSLSGTGTVMTVAPTSLSYGSVKVGTTSPSQTVTITNTGAASVSITNISKSGANPADFPISSNACGSSLAAGASCTVKLTFKPGVTGSRSATLNVNDTGGGSPQTVSLSGTGT